MYPVMCIHCSIMEVSSVPDRSRMHRMQFYIEPQVHDELSLLARRRNVAMAELIREAIASFIARETPRQDDPALRIIGMIDSPDAPGDAAVNHDRYIYRKDWEDR